MTWVKLVYSRESRIRDHYVHPDLVDWCIADISNRYNSLPEREETATDFYVDPGGACMVDSPYVKVSLDTSFSLEAKAEHLQYTAYCLATPKFKTETVAKVYFAGLTSGCVLLPKTVLEAGQKEILTLMDVGGQWQQEFAKRLEALSGGKQLKVFPPVEGEH